MRGYESMSHTAATTARRQHGSTPALTPRDQMIRRVRDHLFSGDREFERYYDAVSELQRGQLSDYLFATPADEHRSSKVFDRLRWGGQFIFVSRQRQHVEQLCARYRQRGYAIEREPGRLRRKILGVPIPFLGPTLHHFIARKVLMVPKGEFTDRFTYNVYLDRCAAAGGQYVVVKEVPTADSVADRLRQRFPKEREHIIRDRAKKLTDLIFPVFLTREAAFLKILERDLPEAHRTRVPRVVEIVKDDRGYVAALKLNWMRKTRRTMSQIDFAIQAADLLEKLHNHARVIHLDLRLDNMVITDEGVGFVDYGSAARVGEDITASPFLNRLFSEIMRTSQIQRMLEKMTNSGLVTAEFITDARHKVDKAVDLFYLAVQVAQPHANPYTKEIVRYHDESDEAEMIQRLTDEVLRPSNPNRPRYSSALEIRRGLEEIAQRLV